MVEIGRFNTLTVVKIVDFGVYLDGGERGEILMPKEYVPANCFPDDEVKAFVYFDSEDRIVATTEHPHVMVGEFAFLIVLSGLFWIGDCGRTCWCLSGSSAIR